MSSGPSTLGIMMTSTTSPTSVTEVVRSSSAQGESSELTRVQSWVSGVLHFLPTSTRPARAVSLSAAGTPSSRLASRTSTVAAMSGTLATILGFDAGKKWITRDGRTGISRGGAGAPTASGRKKSFGERYPGMASDGSWARNWALQARGPRVGGLGLPCLVNRWFGRAARGWVWEERHGEPDRVGVGPVPGLSHRPGAHAGHRPGLARRPAAGRERPRRPPAGDQARRPPLQIGRAHV